MSRMTHISTGDDRHALGPRSPPHKSLIHSELLLVIPR